MIKTINCTQSSRKPGIETLEKFASVLKVPLYLFMLLASEGKDLKDVSVDQARELGRTLLEVLLEAEENINS